MNLAESWIAQNPDDAIAAMLALLAVASAIAIAWPLRRRLLTAIRRVPPRRALASLAAAAVIAGVFVAPNQSGRYSDAQWMRLWVVAVGAGVTAWILYPRVFQKAGQ